MADESVFRLTQPWHRQIRGAPKSVAPHRRSCRRNRHYSHSGCSWVSWTLVQCFDPTISESRVVRLFCVRRAAPKFGGVIKRSAVDSKPWWQPRIIPGRMTGRASKQTNQAARGVFPGTLQPKGSGGADGSLTILRSCSGVRRRGPDRPRSLQARGLPRKAAGPTRSCSATVSRGSRFARPAQYRARIASGWTLPATVRRCTSDGFQAAAESVLPAFLSRVPR